MPTRSRSALRGTAGGVVLLTALTTLTGLLTALAQAHSPADQGLPADCTGTAPLAISMSRRVPMT
ncbi:hypothetical protein [Streptomyces litchfieldiae]|uniref:Uncharacterized protein n=1 Tax=Streptomyces litchfieldiae TaxID=3075543 RepID=A0ABU2MQ91_9ACTN|nr:hypothetical protein [Streptomyces sp. DSM 44938]MDT0343680.1 hypothetical protein [Streptomyces sp. DSM 44938]